MNEQYMECDTCGERYPLDEPRWLTETEISGEIVHHCRDCEPTL